MRQYFADFSALAASDLVDPAATCVHAGLQGHGDTRQYSEWTAVSGAVRQAGVTHMHSTQPHVRARATLGSSSSLMSTESRRHMCPKLMLLIVCF